MKNTWIRLDCPADSALTVTLSSLIANHPRHRRSVAGWLVWSNKVQTDEPTTVEYLNNKVTISRGTTVWFRWSCILYWPELVGDE